jgi:multidrug efflux system membrane fusion protein
MRAIYSYGVALVIVLVLAVWLGSGMLVNGGHGPGQGEKPVISLIEKNGGPLTNTVDGINNKASSSGEIDPAQTIAERTEAGGNGANATPRSVRIQVIKAQAMPIDVPLRGRTKASAQVSVVAQTAGIVTGVNVQKGQIVKAGDTLCTLDLGARQLAVDQAKAAVQLKCNQIIKGRI